jgi:hypothetical protein
MSSIGHLREFDDKFGPGIFLRLNLDHAVVRIDYFLADHQSDARPLRTFGRKKVFE